MTGFIASSKGSSSKTMAKIIPTNLTSIPGVGKSIAGDLTRLGITSVEELKGRDPEQLYDKLTVLDGKPHDRCILYVFRCAVYFAETKYPDGNKLQWWYWKD